MRLLGKARSDHDDMTCCPGHDPGISQGRHHRPKVRGRRAQRAREKAAFRRQAQEDAGLVVLTHDRRCDRDLCHPDCGIRKFAEAGDQFWTGKRP